MHAGFSYRVVWHPNPLRAEGWWAARGRRAAAVCDEMSWVHVTMVNQHSHELEKVLCSTERKDTVTKRQKQRGDQEVHHFKVSHRCYIVLKLDISMIQVGRNTTCYGYSSLIMSEPVKYAVLQHLHASATNGVLKLQSGWWVLANCLLQHWNCACYFNYS